MDQFGRLQHFSGRFAAFNLSKVIYLLNRPKMLSGKLAAFVLSLLIYYFIGLKCTIDKDKVDLVMVEERDWFTKNGTRAWVCFCVFFEGRQHDFSAARHYRGKRKIESNTCFCWLLMRRDIRVWPSTVFQKDKEKTEKINWQITHANIAY